MTAFTRDEPVAVAMRAMAVDGPEPRDLGRARALIDRSVQG